MPEQSKYATWADFSRRMLGSRVSEEDWSKFVNLYQGFIIDYCKRKFVNPKDPEGSLSEDQIFEVAGNICLKLAQGALKNFEHRGKNSFRKWLRSLIHNEVADLHRIPKKDFYSNQVSVQDPSIIEKEYDVPAEENELSEDAIWKQYIALIAFENVCARSTPEQCECFIWHVKNQRKHKEIAELLDLTEVQSRENVRGFLNKIRTELKHLEKDWPLDHINWEEFVAAAEQAREMYYTLAQDFTIRLMEKRNAAKN